LVNVLKSASILLTCHALVKHSILKETA
jgi:hypothetical protein